MHTADTFSKNIMVIGSTCVDIIINIDHLPKTEEDIHPTSQSLALGGCAYNAASMIRLFGAPVTLISPVGTGFYGEYVEKELTKNGFEVKIRVPNQDNGCCYCLVESGGERTFMSYHGAEYTFQKSWMDSYETVCYDMVYVCGLEIEEPTGTELIEYLELHPEREIFYAPGPRGIRIAKETTDRIYALHPILHINEPEAKELTGCSSIPEAAASLAEQTGNTVIITLGASGSYCLEIDRDAANREISAGQEIFTVRKAYTVEGVPAQVTDTIGAGGAHIGAVMAALCSGKTMQTALRLANQAAAKVVSVKGATLTEEDFQNIF